MPGAQSQPPIRPGARIFDLEQPRTAEMPVHPGHQPGYFYALHARHGDGFRPDNPDPIGSASGVIVCKDHTGTHIDALSHISDRQQLFGDVPAAGVESRAGFSRHGVEEIPPIVAPGVLLDVPAALGIDEVEPGRTIAADVLAACCGRQAVAIEAGDVVLVRTGNGRHWRDPERYLSGPGMGSDASRWLADRGVLAVGADNMAWDPIDAADPELGRLPGHLLLLARAGIYIVENLWLEDLAAAAPGTFSFVCAPLKFVGATGSPVRPLALVAPGA